MAISLPDARELPDVVLESLRLRALHGCELGYTEASMAEILGVSRETVCHWWSAYRAGGEADFLLDRRALAGASSGASGNVPARELPSDRDVLFAVWRCGTPPGRIPQHL